MFDKMKWWNWMAFISVGFVAMGLLLGQPAVFTLEAAGKTGGNQIPGFAKPIRWGMTLNELKSAYAGQPTDKLRKKPIIRGEGKFKTQFLGLSIRNGQFRGRKCDRGLKFWMNINTKLLVAFSCTFTMADELELSNIGGDLMDKYPRIKIPREEREAAHFAVNPKGTLLELIAFKWNPKIGFFYGSAR